MTETITAYQVIQKCQEDQPINWEEYCIGAARTVSDKFFDTQVPLGIAKSIMQEYINWGEDLDKVKKALFYGKGTSELTLSYIEAFGASEISSLYQPWDCKVPPHIIHAILGIATEGVELVQALLTALENNTELDMPNIYEESGDFFWYIPLLMSMEKDKEALFNLILRTNLLKLKERFEDKFTEDEAINRDLAAERVILEKTK